VLSWLSTLLAIVLALTSPAFATDHGVSVVTPTAGAYTGDGATQLSTGTQGASIAATPINRARTRSDHVAGALPRSAVASGFAAEAGGAANAANGARLAGQLTEQEARSVFTDAGLLQPEVISNSTEIINGTQLGNQQLVKMLTSDGSNIADWGKYTTPTFRSPSGPFQVHFYYNSATDSVFYDLDYKAVFTGGAR
jgi:hypothetical protein